jgi:hypothetical protein
VPLGHPLRGTQALFDETLAAISRGFAQVCSAECRPSMPLERLLRASTRRTLYSIRSEQPLPEQLENNLPPSANDESRGQGQGRVPDGADVQLLGADPGS